MAVHDRLFEANFLARGARDSYLAILHRERTELLAWITKHLANARCFERGIATRCQSAFCCLPSISSFLLARLKGLA